jgi:hypothetical protein
LSVALEEASYGCPPWTGIGVHHAPESLSSITGIGVQLAPEYAST